MKLQKSFEVRAPVERVWETLIDVERVAPCLPGAEITEAGDDGAYRGTFTVRLGPTTASYRGELHMEETDASAHRAVMRASGQDKRGQGSAKATIVSELEAAGEVTRVEVDTDFTITGRLARFGRGGMIQDISNRLLKDFAECLQQRIEAEPPAAAGAAPKSEDAPAAPAGHAGAEPGGEAADPTAPEPAAARSLAAPLPAAKPISGFSLFFRALWDRIRRIFGRCPR
ncbi:MAG: SRPBCC family protein [Thermoleophilaceae bacterium]